MRLRYNFLPLYMLPASMAATNTAAFRAALLALLVQHHLQQRRQRMPAAAFLLLPPYLGNAPAPPCRACALLGCRRCG